MVNVVKGEHQKIEEAIYSLIEPALKVYGSEREPLISRVINNTKFYDMGKESVSTAVNEILGLDGVNRKQIPYDRNIESYFLLDTSSKNLDKYVLYRNENPIAKIKEHVSHELFGHALFGERNTRIVLQENGIYCIRNGFTLRSPDFPYELYPMWTEGCVLLMQQKIMWEAEGTASEIPQCYAAAYEMARLMQEIIGTKPLQDYLIDYSGNVVDDFNRKLFPILPNAFEHFENLASLHQKSVLDYYFQASYYLKQVKKLSSDYHQHAYKKIKRSTTR